MNILKSVTIASLLFPLIASAQEAKKEEVKDGSTFTWSMNGSFRFYLLNSENSNGLMGGTPVAGKHAVVCSEDKARAQYCDWTGSGAQTGYVGPNNIHLKGKTVQGPLTLAVDVPLYDGYSFREAYRENAADNSNRSGRGYDLLNGTFRRTRLTAEYKEGIVYGKLDTYTSWSQPINSYAGVSIPAGPGTSAARVEIGRWQHSELLGDETLLVPIKDATKTPTLSASQDKFQTTGAKVGYDYNDAGMKIGGWFELANGFDYAPTPEVVKYDKRVYLFGVNAEIDGIKGEFAYAGGQHVVQTRGTPSNDSVTPIVAAVSREPKYLVDLAFMRAKVGYEMDGLSTSVTYDLIQTGNFKNVTKNVNGKITTGDEVAQSKVSQTFVNYAVDLDSTLFGMKDVGQKDGKILVGASALDIKMMGYEDGSYTKLGSTEFDTTVYTGYSAGKATYKLNFERWVTKSDKAYLNDKEGNPTKYWNALYLSAELSI